MTRPWPPLVAALSLFVGAACSSNPAEPEPGGAAGAGGQDAGAAGKAGSAPVRCPAGANTRSEPNLVAVGNVRAQLVDEQGAPTNAGLVQVCGKDVCTQATVGADGKVSQSVGDTRDTPALKFGDGFEWAKLTVLLAEGDNELGTLTTVRLPPYADSAPLLPGEEASSSGVTLRLDDNARVEVNRLDYEDEAQQGLRAAELPPAALEQLGQGFVQAFALSPLETKICPRPALILQNTNNLPPGTPLELYLLGLDVEEEFAPYASWHKVGEGAVSADGDMLQFAEGIAVLTAIGVKVKE